MEEKDRKRNGRGREGRKEFRKRERDRGKEWSMREVSDVGREVGRRELRKEGENDREKGEAGWEG